MGNKNWQGYDKEDKKQSDMERGEYVPPRQRSKRDHGFYGHNHPSMHKKVKCYGEK